jgi:PilZ domain
MGMNSLFSDRRRSPRIRLQVPVFIRGTDNYGESFLDLSRTLDISAAGAYLASSRSIRSNEILSLTIPAPPPTASGTVPAAMAPMQARVRRLQAAGDVTRVGVEFLKPLD